MRRHAGQHGGREDQDRRRAGREPRQGRAGAEARQAPSNPEQRGPENQRRIDPPRRRQVEGLGEGRAPEPAGQSVAEGRHAHRPAEHEDEARIPGARDIEEAAHAGGVEHARQGQAEPEQQAGGERRPGLPREGLRREGARRAAHDATRTRATVSMPVAR